MKKNNLGCRFFYLGTYMCIAALAVLSVMVSAADAGAKLTVAPAHYDFGEIPEGPDAAMTAVIENTGDADVTIKNVRTHCACTNSVLGKQTLKPKEKTTLKIIYATVDRPGIFKKNITIETDIKGQEEVELEVVGFVKEAPGAKIGVTPRKIDAGSIAKGATKKMTFTVTNGGTLPLVIRKISEKSSGAVFFDAGQGDIRIEAGQTKKVDLDFRTGKQGQFTDVLMIDSNAKNAPKGGFAVMVTGKSE
jgi:hypothetical protein